MSLRLITLDLDDTLWPVEPVIAKAEQAFYQFLLEEEPGVFTDLSIDDLRQFRLELLTTRPELQHNISRWRVDSLFAQLRQHGIPQGRAQALSQRAFEVFLSERQKVRLFPGAAAALAWLCEHYVLAAITNGNADVTRMPIGQYFSVAFRAEEVGVSKPAPEIFHAALRETGYEAEQTLHIGDDPHYDIKPAQALGMQTLQATITGKHPSLGPAFSDWQTVPGLIREIAKYCD